MIVLMVGMAIVSDCVVVGAEGQPREYGQTQAARKVCVSVLSGQSNAMGYNDVKEKTNLDAALHDPPVWYQLAGSE
jgi:hypothetical protein